MDLITLITFGIGLLHALLPMGDFNEIICKIPDITPNSELLSDLIHSFPTNYKQENPATSEI